MKVKILFCLIACLLLPLTALGEPFVFNFNGTITGGFYAPRPIADGHVLPDYSIGQIVSGSLYWNNPSDSLVTETGSGQYRVGDTNSQFLPPYWADITIGDMEVDLNPIFFDVGLVDGPDHDSIGMYQTATSAYSYHGDPWFTDLSGMQLNGPNNILSGTAYPDYLDLSLFDSGWIHMQIVGMGQDQPFFEGGIQIAVNNITSVPEPATGVLLLSGLAIFAANRNRLRK